MQKNIKKIFSVLFLATLGVTILATRVNAQTESSIGISPSRIVQNFLRPSLTTRQEIVISRSDTTSPQAVEIQLEDSEISSWIKILPGNFVTIPEGESRTVVTLVITVPDDAQYKKYNSKIKIVLKSSNPSANVNIEPGVEIGLDFIVTDKQVKEFKVLSARIDDTLIQNNLKLLLNIENSGNVPTGPTRAELKIYDTRKQPIANLEKPITKIIEPLTTEQIAVEFNTRNLPTAQYLADVFIYDEENKLIYQQSLSFKIIDTVVDGDSQATAKQFNVLDYWYIALIIFIIILLGKMVYQIIKRSKKQ